MCDQSLSVALQKSISEDVQTLISGLGEVGLDTFLDDGILKDIPFLSTVISTFRLGNSIKEQHFIKKLTRFISEINKGIPNQQKREYYKSRLTNDPAKSKHEIGYILLIIDHYIQYEKSDMLAILYLSFLDDHIDWITFTKYAEVINRFLPGDYYMLSSASAHRTERNLGTDSIQRLVALGLVIEEHADLIVRDEGNGNLIFDPRDEREKKERKYTRTAFGDGLVDILGVCRF